MVTQNQNYETGDPAFAVDKEGKIVVWNTAAEKTFGYSADKALGKRCWKLLLGKDPFGNRYCCRHCPLREMSFRHEPVNSFQSSFKTAAEGLNPFKVSCLTIFDEPGEELLLHICQPEYETAASGNNQASGNSSAKKQLSTLSHREVEVLALLRDGLSTREITTVMCISVRTVRTHIQHIMYKLQVHKRRDAVLLGQRLNLI